MGKTVRWMIAVTTVFVAVVVISSRFSHMAQPPTTSVVITPTVTKVAGLSVLGTRRRPDQSCGNQPAHQDAATSHRLVHNLPGGQPDAVAVPPDPRRIVALLPSQLDALCALGLQGRLVGSALENGLDHQVSYLGKTIRDLPIIGTTDHLDFDAIASLHPDVILSSYTIDPVRLERLRAIAPTVITNSPESSWQDTFRKVAEATNRLQTANELLTQFHAYAQEAGRLDDAIHFQVSILQLTHNSIRIYGQKNFPAIILHDVGVDRPAAQQFVDSSYQEIPLDSLTEANLSIADADVVYISFSDSLAKEHAESILDSPPWRHLSARADNQIFIVNNAVWHIGSGLIAAQGIIDDLRYLNAPIN